MMKELKNLLLTLMVFAVSGVLLVSVFWVVMWVIGYLLGDSETFFSIKQAASFVFLWILVGVVKYLVKYAGKTADNQTDSSIVSASPVSGESVSTVKNMVNILVTSILCSTIVVFGSYGMDHVFGIEDYLCGDTLSKAVVRMFVMSLPFGILLVPVARRLKQEGKPFTPFWYVASRPSLYAVTGFYLLIFFVCLGIGHVALQTASDVLVYLLAGLASVVGTSLLMYYFKNVRKVSAA